MSTETVTLPGSGLVFVNTYGAAVSDAYHTAIVTAENFLQSQFTDAVTVGMSFGLKPLGGKFVALNEFSTVTVSYAKFVSALQSHITTVDDALAFSGMPLTDPSGGIGFSLPTTEARILGLAGPGFGGVDDTVTLNSSAGFTFGQDAIGALEHEITEGVFGRVGSLGITSTTFSPMDLFRFAASGVRDYSGGADGKATFFGIDGAHLTATAFHNSVSAAGLFDGFDLADWQGSTGDAFGNTGPSTPGFVSATDLRVLDILGWTPTGSPAAGGQVLAGLPGGDTVQAGAGNDTITGGFSGANYLRGNAGDDSISGGAQFDDINGNMGNDTAHGNAGDDWVVGGKDNDLLFGDAGGDVVWGNLGNDTLDGGDGNDQVRGGQGDDSVSGGAGDDYVSGDRGNDTISGGSGADRFHGSQDAGIDKVLDFNLAEGDRVMLDPGTTYTVSQVGPDTVIDMGSGNQMILVGVQMSSLTPGWIFEG